MISKMVRSDLLQFAWLQPAYHYLLLFAPIFPVVSCVAQQLQLVSLGFAFFVTINMQMLISFEYSEKEGVPLVDKNQFVPFLFVFLRFSFAAHQISPEFFFGTPLAFF